MNPFGRDSVNDWNPPLLPESLGFNGSAIMTSTVPVILQPRLALLLSWVRRKVRLNHWNTCFVKFWYRGQLCMRSNLLMASITTDLVWTFVGFTYWDHRIWIPLDKTRSMNGILLRCLSHSALVVVLSWSQLCPTFCSLVGTVSINNLI